MQEEWAPKLTETIEYKTQNGGFKRGELSKLFISLAEEFNIDNPDKLKNYYYRVLKKESEASVKKEKPKKQKEITEEKNKKTELILFKSYPGDNADFHSYKNPEDDTKEWVNFAEVEKNISGKSFKEYVKTIDNGSTISDFSFDGQLVNVIEKENLLKTLSLFSGFTRHLNAARQSEMISYLLKANDNKLEEKRTEKYFDSLKFGEIVKVKVAKIMPYGAMVNLLEFPKITGIIHISEIKDSFVDSIGAYFEEEQILEAKFLQRKEGMRINLSTKGLKVPLLNNNSDTDKTFSTIEDKQTVKSVASSEPLQQSNSAVAVLEKPITDVVLEEEVEEEGYPEDISFPDEWKDVSEYVKSFVGPLSPEAKSKLKDLIKEFGLFKFSLGINDATKEFKNDLGLILLSKAEMKLRDGL